MRHKLETAVFSQGWLEGQLENLVSKTATKSDEDPTSHLVATTMWDQWTVVSETMDDLIAENKAMALKLMNARNAVQ